VDVLVLDLILAGQPNGAPRNLSGLTAQEFAAQTRAILERLASALHQSYEQGGALFNDAWKAFADW
jgi:hypothetical protein